jgi:hypothetical protein
MYRRPTGDRGRLRKTDEQITKGKNKEKLKAVREIFLCASTLKLTISFIQLKHRDISGPILADDSTHRGNHFNPFRVFARDRPVDTANHYSPLTSTARANTGSTPVSTDRATGRTAVSFTIFWKALSKRLII